MNDLLKMVGLMALAAGSHLLGGVALLYLWDASLAPHLFELTWVQVVAANALVAALKMDIKSEPESPGTILRMMMIYQLTLWALVLTVELARTIA